MCDNPVLGATIHTTNNAKFLFCPFSKFLHPLLLQLLSPLTASSRHPIVHLQCMRPHSLPPTPHTTPSPSSTTMCGTPRPPPSHATPSFFSTTARHPSPILHHRSTKVTDLATKAIDLVVKVTKFVTLSHPLFVCLVVVTHCMMVRSVTCCHQPIIVCVMHFLSYVCENMGERRSKEMGNSGRERDKDQLDVTKI